MVMITYFFSFLPN